MRTCGRQLAPDDLADDLQVLADGNQQVLTSGVLEDPASYDASGEAVLQHAMVECGIELDV